MTAEDLTALKASLLAEADAKGLGIVLVTGTYTQGNTHEVKNSLGLLPAKFLPDALDTLNVSGDTYNGYFGLAHYNLVSVAVTYAPDTGEGPTVITGTMLVDGTSAGTAFRQPIVQKNMPCAVHILCPEDDSPLLNLSSEGADPLQYISNNSGPIEPPLLGDKWTRDGCLWPCVSTVSQEDADLCAARQSVLCDSGNSGSDGGGGGEGGGPGPSTEGGGGGGSSSPAVYGNHAQKVFILCPDGSPFGFFVPAGIVLNRSQAVADALAKSYGQKAVAKSRFCLNDIRPNACVGAEYAAVILAKGSGTNTVLYDYSLSAGTIPPGLLFYPNETGSMNLDGVPTMPGTYIFEVMAEDATGRYTLKSYELSILGITNGGSLPGGTKEVYYEYQFTAAGGIPPYTFFVESGVLPDGIVLSGAGLLSGTPTTTGAFDFTVGVKDSA